VGSVELDSYGDSGLSQQTLPDEEQIVRRLMLQARLAPIVIALLLSGLRAL
jgi:hypothetical protein